MSCKNWVETFSTHLIKKKSCLSSCLPPIHKDDHAYLTLIYNIPHDYYYRLLYNVWLLLLVIISSKFSTIFDYYEILTFLIDKRKPGWKFPVSSISIPSSTSSAITIFFWRVVFSNESASFLKIKLEK